MRALRRGGDGGGRVRGEGGGEWKGRQRAGAGGEGEANHFSGEGGKGGIGGQRWLPTQSPSNSLQKETCDLKVIESF